MIYGLENLLNSISISIRDVSFEWWNEYKQILKYSDAYGLFLLEQYKSD